MREAVVACELGLAEAMDVLALSPDDSEVMRDLIADAIEWRNQTGGG